LKDKTLFGGGGVSLIKKQILKFKHIDLAIGSGKNLVFLDNVLE